MQSSVVDFLSQLRVDRVLYLDGFACSITTNSSKLRGFALALASLRKVPLVTLRAATPSAASYQQRERLTAIPSTPLPLFPALPTPAHAISPDHSVSLNTPLGKSRPSSQLTSLTQHRQHGSRGHHDRVRATIPSTTLELGMKTSFLNCKG